MAVDVIARTVVHGQSPKTFERAMDAARIGLDFLVRHQVRQADSADFGRFPFLFDCSINTTAALTTNWTSAIGIAALLTGFDAFGDEQYRDAAGRAVKYLHSLQHFGPFGSRVQGVFREVTPQSGMAHPRDALTAAWALADWSQATSDEQSLKRARIYADWFVDVGMEKGYPYWTARFDDQPWEPSWCGSFHSGSAFFMHRMYGLTGEDKYRQVMRAILDFYNTHHLAADGRITVITDRDTHEALDGKADTRFSNRGWEMMHVYNDDFGALANLAAWKLEGESSYRDAAERFLRRMLLIQGGDGGFGPDDYSVPSAGGAVLIELMAARKLGIQLAADAQHDRVVQYVLNLQIRRPGDVGDGAFRGCTGSYTLSDSIANIRAGAYAIIGLLHYAGAGGNVYSIA